MSQYETLSDRLELFTRLVIPYSVLIIAFLLVVVSVPQPLGVFFKSPLLVMIIYYWCVYRPSLLPAWVVFSIGLLFDLVTGVPYTGANAALFVLCRLAVIDQRRFLLGQGFAMVWLGFAIVVALYHILQWLLVSVLSFQFMPFSDFTAPLAVSIIMFPLIYLMLHITHKTLPS